MCRYKVHFRHIHVWFSVVIKSPFDAEMTEEDYDYGEIVSFFAMQIEKVFCDPALVEPNNIRSINLIKLFRPEKIGDCFI